MPIISVKNAQKSYPAHQVQALNNICFDVDAGTTVALVGKSGCGKSTLLNVLAGIDGVDSGEVYVANQALHQSSPEELAQFRQQHVGVVFQFFNLLESLTVEENVALPLNIQGTHSASHIKKAVDEALTLVELSDRTNFYPSQLSGGQMQRVAIARALVHQPAVVLADEPTGNLDSKTGDAILKLLKGLCTELGTTLVLATHSEAVIDMADRVLRLDDGQLVA